MIEIWDLTEHDWHRLLEATAADEALGANVQDVRIVEALKAAPMHFNAPKHNQGFQEKVLRKLDHIERQNKTLMTNVEEVTQAVETLKTDLEAKAAEAKTEFEKLEAELEAASGETPDLTPLKEAIDGIDASVKSAEIPSK